MSRRSAFMLFFISIVSGELMATALSLIFDSLLLWGLCQPVVVVSALFIVGLLGAPNGRNENEEDDICRCCRIRYSVEPPLDCGLGCKPCGSCVARERSKNARTSDS
jgi:hypothetical protein